MHLRTFFKITSRILAISSISSLIFLNGYFFIESIYETYQFKEISFVEIELENLYNTRILIEEGINFSAEYKHEIIDAINNLPESLMRNFPEVFYILSGENYSRIFGNSAGVTFYSSNIAINSDIFEKAKKFPQYNYSFLTDIILHESAHVYGNLAYGNSLSLLTKLLLPYEGPFYTIQPFLKHTEWKGPRYFDSVYPLSINDSAEISTYGKKHIFEDYAESTRFILSGQSHLLSPSRRDYLVEALDIDLEKQNKFKFPLPSFNTSFLIEGENAIPGTHKIEGKEYLAAYYYSIDKSLKNDYVKDLKNILMDRSFFITFSSEQYLRAETIIDTYIIDLDPELRDAQGENYSVIIYVGSDRTKLLPRIFDE